MHAGATELRRLLGCSIEHPLVRQYLDECVSSDDEELGRTDWESPESGYAFISTPLGFIDTIFLYGSGQSDFTEFGGPLEHGVVFGLTRDEVRALMGEPSKSGAPDESVPAHAGWDRYDFPTYSLHFTYNASNGRLDLVTYMLSAP